MEPITIKKRPLTLFLQKEDLDDIHLDRSFKTVNIRTEELLVSRTSASPFTLRELDSRYVSKFNHCQVFAEVDQTISIGDNELNFTGEDLMDTEIFERISSSEIKVLEDGKYKITYGINSTIPQKVGIFINNLEKLRSISWTQ